MKICNECGNQVLDTEGYCHTCGSSNIREMTQEEVDNAMNKGQRPPQRQQRPPQVQQRPAQQRPQGQSQRQGQSNGAGNQSMSQRQPVNGQQRQQPRAQQPGQQRLNGQQRPISQGQPMQQPRQQPRQQPMQQPMQQPRQQPMQQNQQVRQSVRNNINEEANQGYEETNPIETDQTKKKKFGLGKKNKNNVEQNSSVDTVRSANTIHPNQQMGGDTGLGVSFNDNNELESVASFKYCIFFMLKMLIPGYNIYILLTTIIGNPLKYPKTITNLYRAGIIVVVAFSILAVLLAGLLSAILS